VPMARRRVVTEGFHRRVYAVVRLVPAGVVTTYGDVAAALCRSSGSPPSRAVARHVGWALAALPADDADPVPWHRVVNAKGRVAPRAGGGGSPQQALLEAEGVPFDGHGRVPLRLLRHRFDPAAVRAAVGDDERDELDELDELDEVDAPKS
jgi:methylated-DNA-protein-cysteine methyltransferase related protein